MDHQVKAMSPSSSNSMKFESFFNRRKFETIELETLYQRYILKHQQSSIFQVLFILLLLSVTLSILHFAHASISLVAVYCVVQSAVFSIILLLNQVKMIEKDDQFMMITRVTMVSCLIFALIHLPISVKSVIGDYSGNYSGSYSLTNSPGIPGSPDGVWETILVTFLVYSLIPIRTRFALLFGLIVSLVHILVTICCSNGYLFADQIWRQVGGFYTHFFLFLFFLPFSLFFPFSYWKRAREFFLLILNPVSLSECWFLIQRFFDLKPDTRIE